MNAQVLSFPQPRLLWADDQLSGGMQRALRKEIQGHLSVDPHIAIARSYREGMTSLDRDPSILLAIVDLRFPGPNGGNDLIRAIAGRIPTVVFSAFPADLEEDLMSLPDLHTLQKGAVDIRMLARSVSDRLEPHTLDSRYEQARQVVSEAQAQLDLLHGKLASAPRQWQSKYEAQIATVRDRQLAALREVTSVERARTQRAERLMAEAEEYIATYGTEKE